MITCSVNSQNDIYLDGSGNLSMSRELKAVVELCTQASQVLQSELIYAQTRGIPFFDIVFVETPDLNLYEVHIRRALLSVKHVKSVDSVLFRAEGVDLHYEAHITTDFGPEVINV